MATPNINIIFRIFAKNPPSIAFASGSILILIGGTLDDTQMMNYGLYIAIFGFLLQLLWLYLQSPQRRR